MSVCLCESVKSLKSFSLSTLTDVRRKGRKQLHPIDSQIFPLFVRMRHQRKPREKERKRSKWFVEADLLEWRGEINEWIQSCDKLPCLQNCYFLQREWRWTKFEKVKKENRKKQKTTSWKRNESGGCEIKKKSLYTRRLYSLSFSFPSFTRYYTWEGIQIKVREASSFTNSHTHTCVMIRAQNYNERLEKKQKRATSKLVRKKVLTTTLTNFSMVS